MSFQHRTTGPLAPLRLESGAILEDWEIAYEIYGTPNAHRDNVILVCHALTGDQYVASPNPETGRGPWWEIMVGGDKPVDLGTYCVICSNILGGCMGSSGPTTLNEATSMLWGLDFPLFTIGDAVEAQARLLDHVGIDRLFAVVGGSIGGMQALEWMRRFPQRIGCVVAIATSYRQDAQNIAFHVAGRQAVMSDPDWHQGRYSEHGTFPTKGLAVARMIAHVTYMSRANLSDRFGRRLQNANFRVYEFGGGFQIERYLDHQGKAFTQRFDPNSYLYITQAADFFDQSEAAGGNLDLVYKEAFVTFSHPNPPPAACLISFDSDWMYPPGELATVDAAMRAADVPVQSWLFKADAGHDSFLLPHRDMEGTVRAFLSRQFQKR